MKRAAIAVLCSAVFSLAAGGEAEKQSKAESRKSASDNGSGVLMPEFRSLDLDRDGFLSRGELQRYPRAAAGQFEQADLNRDGRLDFEEFKVLHANTSDDRRLGSR